MSKRRIAGIAVCTAGILLVIVLLMYLYAVICQPEMNPFIVQCEALVAKADFLIVQEEQKESEPLVGMENPLAAQGEKDESDVSAENEWIEDAEDTVAAVCEMIRTMDFTVEQPHMELTEEEDRAYREAFLRLLKNELPIEEWNEGEDCYQNLWYAVYCRQRHTASSNFRVSISSFLPCSLR